MKKITLALILSVFIMGATFAQEGGKIPLIGSKAPSFKAQSTEGKIVFPDDYGSNWKVLFSHPRDFTPVCTSELLELAYRQSEFDRLGVKIAVISTDVLSQHNMWKAHLEELDYKNRGQLQINFPIIDDSDASVSKEYGMLHVPTSTTEDVRGVFIIDDNNVVCSVNFYPMRVGRNMDEIVRIIQALQTTAATDVLTPADWNDGDDVLVPYFPYTKTQLEANPDLKNDFYNVGDRLWFKKMGE